MTFYLFQCEAALTIDAVSLIGLTMERMASKGHTDFKDAVPRGRFFSNGSYGVDCEHDPPKPWKLGKTVIEAMKNVSLVHAMKGIT